MNPDLGPREFLEFREGNLVGEARDRLHSFFQRLGEAEDISTPLVIHFHGGLVPYKVALEGAERLERVYQEAGAVPLFVVWNSGLGDALQTNLCRVVGEPVFRYVRRKVARYTSAKERQEVSKSAGTAHGGTLELVPQSEIDIELGLADQDILPFREHRYRATSELTAEEKKQFEADLKADADLTDALTATRELEGGSVLREEFLKDRGETAGQARGLPEVCFSAALDVFSNVIDRRVRRTDHGFYPTIVEEILRRFYLNRPFEWSWATMKGSAADAFSADGGGCVLLKEVKKIRDAGDNRRIVLVGHSAGSIWICHLLRRAAELLPGGVFEVVLLAPACTFDLFNSALETVGKDRLQVRCFAMDNQHESADRVFGMVYPRSLLYLVSGLLEGKPDTPLLGMQRYYSAPYTEPPVAEVVAFLKQDSGRLVWSKTAPDAPQGWRSAATSHGSFDDEVTTLESLKHIVRTGLI